MNLQATFAGGLTVALLVGNLPAGAAAGPGAAEFASELLQKHGILVEPSRRPSLDEINRRIRETERALRGTAVGSEREALEARRDGAVMDLVALAEGLPGMIRSRLEGSPPRLAPPLPDRLELGADEGGLLIRLEAGSGEGRFVVQDLDQARPEHTGAIRIDAAAEGVTWALVGLHHLPVGPTTFPLEIRIGNERLVRTVLTVVAPAFGELKVDLRDGDSGKETPAMVRITGLATGRDRKPANVVEFGGQFDGNGSPSPQRRVNLPGRLGGPWWCVAGPFRMALPPGEYEIAVRRGVEHVPVFETITVRSGALTSLTCRPRRWVDMRRQGWFSGDDHVHGRMVSDEDAERLLAWVRAEDIHLANVVKMGDIYRTWFEQRGWGPKYRVAYEDYVLSPGQECPRTHEQLGHTLSMNTRGLIRDVDQYFLYDRVADEVRAQGGLFGYAHVNADLFFVHRDMTLNVPRDKVDFGEVLQFNRLGTEVWYEFLNTGFKLTAAAGSDVPWGGSVGEVRMYAHLGSKRFSADAWFEAVRRGRTLVTSGPMLEFRIDDALPGDEIRVKEPRQSLRVRARAWGHAERSLLRQLAVIRHGDVLREARPEAAAEGVAELVLDFEVPAGDGAWLAARAESADGTMAHTTPIYVVRPPLRFWKHDEVPALLDRRLKSLTEIEELVASARARVESGGRDTDRAWRQLARQGEPLLERVAEARRLYGDLRRVAEREAASRTARAGAGAGSR